MPRSELKAVFVNWEERLRKCIEMQGEYVSWAGVAHVTSFARELLVISILKHFQTPYISQYVITNINQKFMLKNKSLIPWFNNTIRQICAAKRRAFKKLNFRRNHNWLKWWKRKYWCFNSTQSWIWFEWNWWMWMTIAISGIMIFDIMQNEMNSSFHFAFRHSVPWDVRDHMPALLLGFLVVFEMFGIELHFLFQVQFRPDFRSYRKTSTFLFVINFVTLFNLPRQNRIAFSVRPTAPFSTKQKRKWRLHHDTHLILVFN
jgi:hypothetical protein